MRKLDGCGTGVATTLVAVLWGRRNVSHTCYIKVPTDRGSIMPIRTDGRSAVRLQLYPLPKDVRGGISESRGGDGGAAECGRTDGYTEKVPHLFAERNEELFAHSLRGFSV